MQYTALCAPGDRTVYPDSRYRSRGHARQQQTAHLLTLAEAVDRIYYGASFERCKETRRVDLASVRDRIGASVLVRDVRPRLRCRSCGSRKIIVTTLWQTATASASMLLTLLSELPADCRLRLQGSAALDAPARKAEGMYLSTGPPHSAGPDCAFCA
jgi:hypothetical protein